jgi:hypothetical protein
MTSQASERIVLDGQMHILYGYPLADWFEFSGTRSPFVAQTSMLWRGYIGTWAFKDGRLYLIALKGSLSAGEDYGPNACYPGRLDDEKDAALQVVFPGCARVFAHWYSGTLHVPLGRLLHYERNRSQNLYERELLIDVRRGLLLGITERQNDDPQVNVPAGDAAIPSGTAPVAQADKP